MAERLVVVGGDAGGMAAASQARRRRPHDLEIVALEKGRWTSYSACGIPYLVGGDVGGLDDLVARSPQTFRERFRIDVRIGHEAVALDLDQRKVEVRDLDRDRTYSLGFDQLHLGTGAVPVRPDLPGIGGPEVHGVQTLEDAAHLLDHARSTTVGRVVVVGGGYIGLEMAEAFVKRGAAVTVVCDTPQPMATLDEDMGALVAEAMRDTGIELITGEKVVGFEPGAVLTESDRGLPADLVVLGLGVRPNVALAAEAGVALGPSGAIRVDRRQRTGAEGVWAAGDCCESHHRVTGRPVHLPLGTVANKQGRVAGINLSGGYATFPGVVGTAVTRLCSLEVARTGLSERQAEEAGFLARTTTIDSTTRAGYFPGTQPLRVRLVVERGTGRLLGGQIVGREGAAKRIDVIATAVTAGLTADEVIGLDLSYAPPFGPVWDPVLVAARKAVEPD